MSAIVDRLVADTVAYAVAVSGLLIGGDQAEVDAAIDRVNEGLIALSHMTRADRSGAAHELELYSGER